MSNQGIGGRRCRKNDNCVFEKMEEILDCMCVIDNMASENPHLVGMAPVEGEVSVMVQRSASHNFLMMVRRMVLRTEGVGFRLQVKI